jgi:hypothetical protein
MDEVIRADLRQRFDEHRARPVPTGAWGHLEDGFATLDAHPEVAAVSGPEVVSQWGSADFVLYDTYVAGHDERVLANATLEAEIRPDRRLTRYLDLCEERVSDASTQASMDACRGYIEQLNQTLELACAPGPRSSARSSRNALADTRP